MKVTRIGLDIAKQIFELHGVDQRERVVLRKTLKRDRVLEYFAQLEPCKVALEACGGAHYWYREISKLGHTVRLLPTNKVKPADAAKLAAPASGDHPIIPAIIGTAQDVQLNAAIDYLKTHRRAAK